MQRCQHASMASSPSPATQNSSGRVDGLQTCVLKVSIHCGGCQQKVRKLIQKIDGVCAIQIDADQVTVTVSAGTTLDPATLITTLAKSGKHAQLLSPPKASCTVNVNSTDTDNKECGVVEQRLQAPQPWHIARGATCQPKAPLDDGNNHNSNHRPARHVDGRQPVKKDRNSTKGAFGMSHLRGFMLPFTRDREQRYVRLGNARAVHDHDGCEHHYWSQDTGPSYLDDFHCDGRGTLSKDTTSEPAVRDVVGDVATVVHDNRSCQNLGGTPRLCVGVPLIPGGDDPDTAFSNSLSPSPPNSTTLAALFQASASADNPSGIPDPPIARSGPVGAISLVSSPDQATRNSTGFPVTTHIRPDSAGTDDKFSTPTSFYPGGMGFMPGVRQQQRTVVQHPPPLSPMRAGCTPLPTPHYTPCLL